MAQFATALRTEMAAIPRSWPFQKAVAADRFSPPLLKHDLSLRLVLHRPVELARLVGKVGIRSNQISVLDRAKSLMQIANALFQGATLGKPSVFEQILGTPAIG